MEHKPYIKHTCGKRAVLFIHGFLGSPNGFNEIIKVLPENYGVYNMLLKGHGGSVRDFAASSMKEWKAQVRETVDELLVLYDELIICSHSMGCLFALEESIRRPDGIKNLILLGIPLKIRIERVAFVNSFRAFFKLFSKGDKWTEAYKNTHSVRLNFKLWEYIGWLPRCAELIAESIKARQPVLDVKCRATVIFSKKDELVSGKTLCYIRKNKDIKIQILPESSHFMYSEKDFERRLKLSEGKFRWMNELITEFLKQRLVSDVGFSKCENTPFENLDGAVSVVMRLSDSVVEQIDSAPTHTYFQHYRTMNAYIDSILLQLVMMLQEKGYNAAAVPASQSVEGLSGIFSHKETAVKAGLGYIGKSCLFISHKHGPRVRLGTVFTDAPIETVCMTQKSECGDCNLCAKSCGAMAIKNVEFCDGMAREDIFDAKACSDYMKEKFKHIGRGAVCGVCMSVCPKGKNK